MRTLILLLAGVLAAQPGGARAELYYLIVSGIGGDPTYAERFAADAAEMLTAAETTLGGTERIRTLIGDEATREAVTAALVELAGSTASADRLAVFLIGHGSYDGTEYKYNLRGEDISGTELAELLGSVPAQSQLIVNMTSASGSVLESWAEEAGRVVITATRSGAERNATRFAEHWASALAAEEADLDKNGSISVQEAYDYASRRVADSYSEEGALATEHPELRGEAAGAFEVARLTTEVATTPGQERLFAERDSLLEQITALRLRRDEVGDEYQAQMLELQLQLAVIQEQIDQAAAE